MKLKEHIGFGSSCFLAELLHARNARRILLVTGKNSFRASSAEAVIIPLLTGFEVQRFDEVAPNPDISGVMTGLEAYRSFLPDAVVAVGGGSVLDTAKMLHFFGSNTITPSAWLVEKPEPTLKAGLLVAIPTTAGSGSEATPFSVLYINGVKHSVEHPWLLPDVSIVDPVFSSTASPQLTAEAGFDALAQAIESLWSTRSTVVSLEYARNALKLIVPNLIQAIKKGKPEARLAMATGAHLAGKAIAISRTTAPHAVSYPMTSRFGITHGHAVAILLPAFLRFNAAIKDSDLQDTRGCSWVRERLQEICFYLGEVTSDAAAKVLRGMVHDAGLEQRLSLLGVLGEAEISTIVAEGFTPERVKNNPRVLTENRLQEMLKDLL